MRRFVVPLTVAAAGLAAVITATPASAHAAPPGVAVTGTVTTPATYTTGQLAALAQTTLPDTRFGPSSHTVTGVNLEDLVNVSGPVLPAGAKNASLRVVLTVSGIGHRDVAIALGELDPFFGSHPALLALSEDGHRLLAGPDLVFPGDHGISRTVVHVTTISVAVTNPATVPVPSAAGSVVIVDGQHTRTLSAAQIARLRPSTLSVSFLAGASPVPQVHTEVGPTLAQVLRAAGVCTSARTAVAAVGSDGYVATVTPAEAGAGGRPLLLSTSEDGIAQAQPRLVTDGDVHGGRYVSGVVELIVTG